MEQKSNGFLKITGILMIIGGAFGLIFGVITVLGVALVASLLELAGESVSAGMLTFAAVLFLVSGIIEFVAGILGVANSKKPDKASVCIVFGILTAVLAVVSIIFTMVGGGDFSVLNLCTGLVLPILYLIGAFQMKSKAA